MANDARLEYWIEAAKISMEEIPQSTKLGELEREQWESIGRMLMLSSENIGLAFYQPSHGPSDEVAKLREKIRTIEADARAVELTRLRTASLNCAFHADWWEFVIDKNGEVRHRTSR
jgi:hypothetical protein